MIYLHRFRLIAAAKLLVAALLLGAASAPTLAQSHGPGGIGEMGGQMGTHGGGQQQQLYPSLMAAPPADPAAREAAQREAHRRMTSGLPLLREGLEQATRALQAGDAQGMREAADRLSEGLNLYRSGASTHLALIAGHAPAQAGLGWYRGQLALPPVATVMPMATGAGVLWGLSWFHLTTMAFLAAFVVGTLLIQYTRMRRIGGLVHRLATASTAIAPGPAAAPAGGPPGPGPAAPPPPGAAALPIPRATAVPAAAAAPSRANCCADPLCGTSPSSSCRASS
ncbi:MAG: hypothetical protein HYX38_37700 [Rhodospirillales bacterium]|nr:hypothetical protein [Rhodospirillales bacterium]